ncbi:cytoplasmic protein [Phyllobacterium salinisoli]|uniref:Cytoplasmic protein n=1 Tax=Phyllobacterium salinisoli TaxID=1899321 RepID=A0A368K594_9HYPH|nr:cytoplasmic protein [Phyllobacterium salinisoli]RCS23542.1 cytoplasmic protein [Phyllobacterium salinisoli]
MISDHLAMESRAFLASKEERRGEAMQRAALQILCGIDFDALLVAQPQEKAAAIRRLGRLIQRERIKGIRGHWSYDLNRHIALKQALEKVKGSTGVAAHVEA